MATPPILDPYPGFERSLLPSLTQLDSLLPYQLALVPFHPEASTTDIDRARALFQRRRVKSLARREELGLPEKEAELRQLQRAQDWLEGKVPGSKRMVDREAQASEERLFNRQELNDRIKYNVKLEVERVLEKERKRQAVEVAKAVETALEEEKQREVERMQAEVAKAVNFALRMRDEAEAEKARQRAEEEAHRPPTPQFPPVPAPLAVHHLPSPPADDAPPGPFYDFDSLDTARLPPDLLRQLCPIRLDNVPPLVTPQLIAQFLLRRQSKPFPRPLAVNRSTSSASIMIAFPSRDLAALAVQILDGQALPLFKYRISTTAMNSGGHIFRWKDVADEVRTAWATTMGLPPGRWIPKVPGPPSGIKVSPGYHAEWQRIMQEEERRVEAEQQQMQQHQQLMWEEQGQSEGYYSEDDGQRSESYDSSGYGQGQGYEQGYHEHDGGGFDEPFNPHGGYAYQPPYASTSHAYDDFHPAYAAYNPQPHAPSGFSSAAYHSPVYPDHSPYGFARMASQVEPSVDPRKRPRYDY
ncbi:hypothetical protein JCM8097_000768 [Rhodosporidiobolus ruineniae]